VHHVGILYGQLSDSCCYKFYSIVFYSLFASYRSLQW